MKSTRLTICALACLAAGLAAQPAAANVQVGSSGWLWGNPLPQGNTLRAIAFAAGGRGYAVGDFGTILSTADGGSTWSGLPAGTFTNLARVQTVGTSTVIAGGGCVMRRSDNAGVTFTRIPFTPSEALCREGLAAFSFTSDKNGFIVLTDGTVNQTADGGQSFAQKTAVPGTRSPGGSATPTDVAFLDDATGYASTSDGKIFQTTDGANSWKAVSDTGRAVRSLFFADKLDGFAVGDGGLFLRTNDGGATWTPKATGTGADLTSVRCATPTLCLVTTKAGDVLLRTTDGGETFGPPVTPSTDPIYAAAFASTTRVVAGGQVGATVVSDDAGQTFAKVGGRLSGRYTRVRATAHGAAYAAGANGALAKTIDGGKTWTAGNVATSEDVQDVSFPDVANGFALDAAGGLFRTKDGGAHWSPLDIGTTARPSAVYAADATHVLVIGPSGIRRSSDAGETFSSVRKISRTRLGDIDVAGSALVAWGSQDLIESTDGGATFKALRKPGPYQRVGKRLVNRTFLRLVDFVSGKIGYVVDGVGRLWHTGNAGRSWKQLAGTGTEQTYGMAFSDANKGFLVISFFGDVRTPSGFLLRTADGGKTWHPQLVVSTPIGQAGIAAPGGGIDYLLAGDSNLFATTSGGDAGAPSTLTITTPHRKLKKAGRIQVTGKLSPAVGGERVTVSARLAGKLRWAHQTVPVASNGSFTTTWFVPKGDTQFVAQWPGDFKSSGDGSPVLQVSVRKR